MLNDEAFVSRRSSSVFEFKNPIISFGVKLAFSHKSCKSLVVASWGQISGALHQSCSFWLPGQPLAHKQVEGKFEERYSVI